MFKEGKEIEYFRNYDEMVGKIRYYKDRPDDRLKLYKAGRARLKDEHTYKVRAKQLITLHKKLSNDEKRKR
jgi:spore maturation protein CgeB